WRWPSAHHTLEFGRESVHAPSAGRRDLDGLGKHAAGLAVAPPRIEQIDVEGEHVADLETIADHLDRLLVGGQRVMPEAWIFEGAQPRAVAAPLKKSRRVRPHPLPPPQGAPSRPAGGPQIFPGRERPPGGSLRRPAFDPPPPRGGSGCARHAKSNRR